MNQRCRCCESVYDRPLHDAAGFHHGSMSVSAVLVGNVCHAHPSIGVRPVEDIHLDREVAVADVARVYVAVRCTAEGSMLGSS